MDLDRKQILIHELTLHAGEKWAATASAALREKDVRSEDEGGTSALSSVGDLLRIYRNRLDRCTENGVEAYGIRELLDSLSRLPVDDIVAVEPFLGVTTSVDAFWENQTTLLGCVTVLNFDSNRGNKTLATALESKN